MQALGYGSEDKYGVKVKQVISILRQADPTDSLAYEWIRRLALNTSISNADAHAKNYSVLFRPNGVEIAPMYDVLTTTYWPDVRRIIGADWPGTTASTRMWWRKRPAPWLGWCWSMPTRRIATCRSVRRAI